MASEGKYVCTSKSKQIIVGAELIGNSYPLKTGVQQHNYYYAVVTHAQKMYTYIILH